MKKSRIRIIARILLAIVVAAFIALGGFAVYAGVQGATIVMNILAESRYEEIVEEAVESGSNPILSNVNEIEYPWKIRQKRRQ